MFSIDNEGKYLTSDGEKHGTREDAIAHIKSVHKGFSGFPTSFEEFDDMKAQVDKKNAMVDLHIVFESIVDSIIFDDDVEDKANAIRVAANEMATRLDSIVNSQIEKNDKGVVSFLVNAVKSLIKPPKKSNGTVKNSITFYKGIDNRRYWIGRYSNNFRDDDNPPEIISADSHKKFAELVKSGIVNPPDLWLWHERDWKWGTGQWVTYDDTGFALAGGIVDEPFNELADVLQKQGDLMAMSHGMPAWSITRDKNDDSIITEHITEEVSVLPVWAAANKLTQFSIIENVKEMEDMAISKSDKARLISDFGVSSKLLEQFELVNEADAEKALGDDRERKSITADQEPEEEPKEDAASDDEQESPAEAKSVSDGELGSILTNLIEAVATLGNNYKSLETEIQELKRSDSEKIARKTQSSPLASLASSVAQSIVGNDATRVDGRSKLAKSSALETESEAPRVSPFPWVNSMIAGKE